ncbi:hypothetical protein H6G96_33910 [Nostoc sp. FACHB-892]|uniref:tetratricopeptide repeat protein n=1 Tax=Nostoc sp. FACHB-892 TaxID=2692843 RepID=UPI001685944B|nr:hypothetical protein [Nostoc sp. FACHB-892]MBD2731180.1 hypothetical protein [Nostoc sp. FACHB-892]
MQKSYSQVFIVTLSLLTLLDTVSFIFLSPTLAQTTTCQQQQQQDTQIQINILVSDLEQDIPAGKNEQAISRINQAIQIALKAQNSTVTRTFLTQLFDSYLPQESLLGRLAQQIEPSQKPQLRQLLTSLTSLTQSLNSSYSVAKTQSLTRIANYFRIIGEQQQALSLLTQALTTSQSIKGAEFQTKALTPIAQEYLALKQTVQAEQILAQSLQFAQQIQPQEPIRRVLVLETIAVTYAQLGKTERALQLVTSISDPYYRSRIRFEVVKQLTQTNQLEAAQKLAQNIETPEFKGRSFVEIALADGNKGQQQLADQNFAAALQATGNDSNAVYLQAPLIQTYAKGGQKDAAYKVAQRLQNVEQKALTLGIIANEYSKAGQLQKVEQIITELTPLIQTPEAIDNVGFLQNILANSLAEKQYKLAFDLVSKTKRNDFMGREDWLSRITDAAIKARNIELPLQIAQKMDKADIDQRNRLLQKVAEGYAQNKQLERALSIVQQINNSGNSVYKVQTLALVATAFGKTAQTDKLLNQATAEARKLAPQQRAFALVSVAQAFLKIGNQPQAKKLLAEAIQAVQTEKDSSVRDNLLQRMSEPFIAAKQYNAALQIIQAIPTTTRDYRLPELAKLVIENGSDASEIVNILSQNTKNPENKTRGLISIGETYLRTQKIQSAKQVSDLAFAAAKTISNPESRVLNFGNPPDITVVDDDGDRASSLEKIALLKAKISDYNQALVVAQVIQDKKLREQLVQQLLCYRK